MSLFQYVHLQVVSNAVCDAPWEGGSDSTDLGMTHEWQRLKSWGRVRSSWKNRKGTERAGVGILQEDEGPGQTET